jgi:hypothetical protein
MAIQLNQNFHRFQVLYSQYKSLFEEYIRIEQSKLFVLFNVRLCLTLGIKISFDNDYSYTKTNSVSQTYKLLIKLSDAWFAYEALLILCESENLVQKNNGSIRKPNSFDQATLTSFNLSSITNSFNDYLATHLITSPKRKSDLLSYLLHLHQNTKGETKELVQKTINRIMHNTLLEWKHIVATIYAIRNLYIHNGDTAGTGVNNNGSSDFLAHQRKLTKILALKC